MSFPQTGGATGSGERQADLGAALPAPPGKPGVLALPSLYAPSGGRPEGAGPARWARARASPGTPGRPPAEASVSLSARFRLRSLRRGPTGSWAAASFLLTSGAAGGGGAASIYIKGEPAGPAEPGAPARPAPSPCAGGRGRSAGALRGRGPRSGQSAAPDGARAGPHPA